MPPILNLSLIIERAIITSQQAEAIARQLLEKEGIFGGQSSGGGSPPGYKGCPKNDREVGDTSLIIRTSTSS